MSVVWTERDSFRRRDPRVDESMSQITPRRDPPGDSTAAYRLSQLSTGGQ